MRALIIGLCLLIAPGLASAERFRVGETQRVFRPAHARHWRGAVTHGLITRIWYPADPGMAEAPRDIGPPGHPIFKGEAVAREAPLAAAWDEYPVLLLSHGTGGSADSLAWLAALASDGFVVVAVNHPGNNALEPLTRDGFQLWWERATDLSNALDAVLIDRKFASRLDRARVGAVGFSLGGYTVLELAGARTTPGALEAFCASPQADATCHPPEMDLTPGGLDLRSPPSAPTAASLARAGASYRDARIKAVFAIAPAPGMALDPASLKEIRIPVAVLAGDADPIAPLATNALRIAGALGVTPTLLPGVGHYTFLDTCLASAAETLAPICKDGPGIDRAAVHARTIALVRDFFATHLR
jgi:predicted dienelactone hydrolase